MYSLSIVGKIYSVKLDLKSVVFVLLKQKRNVFPSKAIYVRSFFSIQDLCCLRNMYKKEIKRNIFNYVPLISPISVVIKAVAYHIKF